MGLPAPPRIIISFPLPVRIRSTLRSTLWTLFLSLSALSAQPAPLSETPPSSPGESSFPPLLVEEGEFLAGDRRGPGTLLRNRFDFIIAAGDSFQGDPPPSRGAEIESEGRTSTSSGLWNNGVIREVTDRVAARTDKKERRTFLERALKRMQAGLRSDPLFFPFLYNTARLEALLGRNRDAIRHFRRAGALAPRLWSVDLHLGRLYMEEKQPRAALSHFRSAARKNPFAAEPLTALGDFYREGRNFSQARSYYELARERNQESQEASVGLAAILMEEGRLQEARSLLHETIRFNRNRGKPIQLSLHHTLALIARKSKEYGEERRELQLLLERPGDPFFLEHPRHEIEQRLARLEMIERRLDSPLKEESP